MALSPDAVLPPGALSANRARPPGHGPQQLADVLERVLDKGIVIAGDIQVRLLDIELLTIKLRLVVASLEKAREMGIDWWEGDPFLSSRARLRERPRAHARVSSAREARALPERRKVGGRRAPAAKKSAKDRRRRRPPTKE